MHNSEKEEGKARNSSDVCFFNGLKNRSYTSPDIVAKNVLIQTFASSDPSSAGRWEVASMLKSVATLQGIDRKNLIATKDASTLSTLKYLH